MAGKQHDMGESEKVLGRKQKYFFLASFLVVVLLSAAVMFQFLSAILTGGILAYLSFPMFKWLKRKVKSKAVSGILTVVIVILIIIIPLIFTLNILSREAYNAYLITREASQGALLEQGCSANSSGVYCTIVSRLGSFMSETDIAFYLGEAFKKGALFLVDASSNFIFSIPSRLFELFLALFIMYYLLQDGPRLIDSFWEFVPFKKSQERKLQEKIGNVVHGVVYGQLLTSFAQGVIAGIGFFIFGLPSPVVWGILTAIAALIPMVGTAIVWGPASLYLIIKGVVVGSWVAAGRGIGLFAYGMLIVGTVDNFLKPKLISGKAKLHPALVLIGLLGGLKLMGIVGVIYGPLILGLLVTFMEIYGKEFEF
ncbi:AI-2E family transporter [Candidatus Woesearchaeota archaeon]|nr:MAG: AI-2E family transporter [Candidatus Woesearchaeota archaeon]